MKANVNIKTALDEVNKVFRSGELVLSTEIIHRPNMITFITETDKMKAEYAVDKKEKMIEFLEQLIEIIPPFHRYDIDDLIEELIGGENE